MAIHKILVPTDFSEPATKALHFAAKIAGENNSKVIIFHAVGLHLAVTAEEAEFNNAFELEKIENEQLAALRLSLGKRYPKTEFEALTKTGFPVELIPECASSRGVDLIVMGTRGASGMKEILVGSNTSSLIRHTEIPVLAVPEESEYQGMNKIVFATNMQPDDIVSLKKIIALFGKKNPEITLLHIEDGHARDPEAALRNWFQTEVLPTIKYAGIKAESISETDIVKTLHDYLSVNKTDLLVTATRKRNFIERIFDRSITQRLVFHTKIPLLAIHSHGSKGEIVL
ncbi:MAG: universal stress protein [Bacteroidia bacterium]|nr:universal stress protein [Bacteroidia bacterium]